MALIAGIANAIESSSNDKAAIPSGPSFSGIITEWTVTAGQTITLLGHFNADYLYDVDWGDSSTDTGVTITNKTHTYTDAGTYTVKISGQFAGFRFGNSSVSNKLAITNFVQWGTDTVIQALFNMFSGCENMVYSATDNPTITLKPGVTNHTRLDTMFFSCRSITNLNLSGWNWTNPELVAAAPSMFYLCTNLETLNLTGWSFPNCVSLASFARFVGDATTNGCAFEWDNLTIGASQFGYSFNRSKLSSFSMENLTFNSSGVTFVLTFYQANLLFSSLDLSSWVNTSNITSMHYMFRSLNYLGLNTIELNVTGWDTSNVTTMFGWLYEARYLTEVIGLNDLRGDSLTGTGFQSAIYNCTRLTFNNNNFHPDFGANWSINTMNSSFRGIASQLSGVTSDMPDMTNWNTSIVTNFNSLFRDGDWNATNYTMFDLSSAVDINQMFFDGDGIVNLDMSQSNLSSSCTSAFNFARNSQMETVDLSNCDFSAVTTIAYMFYSAPINSLTFDNTVSFASVNSAVNFLQNNIGGMTTAEYDNFLVRLDTTGLSGAYILTAGDSTYTTGGAGDTARASLVSKGWTISDDGGV